MSQQFIDCRVCGLQFSNEDMVSHELTCLQRSQEQINYKSTPSNKQGFQSDVKENNPVSANNIQNQTMDSAEEDEGDEEIVEFLTEDNILKPGGSQSVLHKVENFQESPKLQSKLRNIRSTPGCHLHNAKYSGYKPSMSYDRKKPKNLFPPTKKYRYYPVTCEYCGKRFQPNELKAHQRKQHFGETDEGYQSRRVQSAAIRKGYREEQKSKSRSKSVGGIPRRLQVCYICGKLYGSKSIKIHEPKCLDKWRIQNEQLPPHRRAREPVKYEPIEQQISPGQGSSLPDFDPVAEAAFLSHLNSLIPCTHCSRTFSADRIMKHESCCIERPRTRQCITPADGKIVR